MSFNDNRIERVSEPEFRKVRRPVLVRIFGRWFLSAILLSLMVAGAVTWAWFNFTAPGPLRAKKVVFMAKDASREQIAATLEEQGVVTDARIFSAAAAMNELRRARLRPGEYEFPAGATMQDVLAMITSGKFITYKITIPEGWTSQMVAKKLTDQPELDGTISQVPEEGAVRPDTYIFQRGLSRDKMLADMQAAQNKLVDQEWSRLAPDSPIKTKRELLTLASIVEKETGVASERPLVAAVFLNRMKKRMRLQSDPTIIYGLVGGKGKLDHPITRTELDQNTPYNTYQVDGLPPGPIANPGKAAIEAVLEPAKVDYIYFVADGTGGHAFATTLDEHNANVRKWRAQSSDPSPAPDAPAPTAEPKAEPPVAQSAASAPVTAPAAATPVKAAVKPPEKKPPPPVKAAPTGVQAVKTTAPAPVAVKKVPIPTLKKPKKP